MLTARARSELCATFPYFTYLSYPLSCKALASGVFTEVQPPNLPGQAVLIKSMMTSEDKPICPLDGRETDLLNTYTNPICRRNGPNHRMSRRLNACVGNLVSLVVPYIQKAPEATSNRTRIGKVHQGPWMNIGAHRNQRTSFWT